MKIILNTTKYNLGETQLRQMSEILDEECQVIRTSEPLEYDDDEEVSINPGLATDFAVALKNEIDSAPSRPNIIILDIPRKAISYIEALYEGTDIQRYYILPVLSKVTGVNPLTMKYVVNKKINSIIKGRLQCGSE